MSLTSFKIKDLLLKLISNDNALRAIGKQTITASGTAQRLTVPTGAVYAQVTVSGGTIRYWLDGSTPTSTQGLSSTAFDISGTQNILDFKFIELTATAVVQVQFFG
jgi:hypothetical protein